MNEPAPGMPCTGSAPAHVRAPLAARPGAIRLGWLTAALLAVAGAAPAAAQDETFARLKLPQVGDLQLEILSPTCLEIVRINTKQPDRARVDSWDWVDGQGRFVPPDLSGLRAIVNGQTNGVAGVGFKRRPVYALLYPWETRIANYLYLQLGAPVGDGQTVQLLNDGSLWPAGTALGATADPLRYSPALHINQEGYMPNLPKRAMVGYYLGSLGELPVPSAAFSLVDAETGAAVYQGALKPRPDAGYLYTPTPYQQVYEADFSGFATPGRYRLAVPGLGATFPFRIDEGTAMNFARTYALGVFHQRSGFNVDLPFTRFTHAADHLAPAAVPVDTSEPFAFTWQTVASYAGYVNPDNPPQTAPRLLTPADQLYPFINTGPVDVSGGHFEAANYSKVVWNQAQVVHVLLFAADSLPGVGALDNLGLPESGDGVCDALQEAKWEAGSLLKMQDADGGFYYMMYPQFREYEFDVLPEHGDPQVVWPKNTGSTAAAVAALAACSSSPKFKQAYPETAAACEAAAQRGWRFLTNAISTHGWGGAYQRIMHFDDTFTHADDLAWAACEMFLATGQAEYRDRLYEWFPDPTDPATIRWGWLRMHVSYGNAIRSYAFAVKSGRLAAGQLDPAYLAKCVQAIVDCGNDNLQWSRDNAYGTSFPNQTKRVLNAGWYYSTDQAFDLAVAAQFNPDPALLDAILLNLNFEAGCNPVNVSYITGLGWKRQRQIVDQYSANDRRVLPKIGIPVSNIQAGFVWTWTYGGELTALCFPGDGAEQAPYPFYDRWADFWNVSTEASTSGIVRSYATTLWLAAQSGLASQPWRAANATLAVPPGPVPPGQPVTVSLQLASPSLQDARITWEARDREPAFGGSTYTFTPALAEGTHWIEAEAHWPDGRRAFAAASVQVGAPAPVDPPQLSAPQFAPGAGFSFTLSGLPNATYYIQASTNLVTWVNVVTNTLPAAGAAPVSDPTAPLPPARYYRAVKAF